MTIQPDTKDEIEMEKAGRIRIPDTVGPSLGDLRVYLRDNYPGDEPRNPMLKRYIVMIERLLEVGKQFEEQERKG